YNSAKSSFFFFSSRRRHTRFSRDWSSDVCSSDLLRSDYGADGVNLGMNLGDVAGAGITGHVHQHAVPRWRGDSNFLPIVARTKALPELLATTRERLAASWPQG